MKTFARRLFPRLISIGYRFFDLEAKYHSPSGRVIEASFVISKLAKKGGKVLDVGCTDPNNICPCLLASLGWDVYGLDIREYRFEHPRFHYVHGDIRKASFDDGFFDCVYALSSLEHIGLSGRYGVTKSDDEGDIKAAGEIARILRPGGTFLCTLPYGVGQLVKPLHRIYDRSRLEKLLHGWKIQDEMYYVLGNDGCYAIASEDVAGRKDYMKGERALALLELTPLK